MEKFFLKKGKLIFISCKTCFFQLEKEYQFSFCD